MSAKPVLEAIRALVKFQGSASVAEIASYASITRRRVIDTINANLKNVDRGKRGRIIGTTCQQRLRQLRWASGMYYRAQAYGMFSHEGDCLAFQGNAELRKRLEEPRVIGALGDNRTESYVIDTPENRAAVEEAGLRPWEEAVIDDSLWIEA